MSGSEGVVTEGKHIQLIFSSLYSESSIAARYSVATSGKMRPSGFKYLSRARRTVSSIDS